jgi:hypothetical protein
MLFAETNHAVWHMEEPFEYSNNNALISQLLAGGTIQNEMFNKYRAGSGD